MVDCTKTENYLREKLRMTKRLRNGVCQIKCTECPLSWLNNGTLNNDDYAIFDSLHCEAFEMLYPEKAIETIQRWSNEHPQKTYLTDFLKHYPNVQLRTDGTPAGLCPHQLGLNKIADCGRIDNCCAKCWNQTVEDSEEND